ncbi:MAG TPA: tRNA pseudouridine(13) synthase TruD [Planctomycetes bacterium]|nr:tRNA pseudouridine(13) synthase TruD [Planctomycetota bacterium]
MTEHPLNSSEVTGDELVEVEPAEVLLTDRSAGYSPPRLLPDVRPTGGVIRERWEDFKVTEIPLYTPCGAGEHLYITIEKSNRTTIQARNHIARVMGVHPDSVGFAGFKDKRAITTQTFSVAVLSDAQVASIDAPWIRVMGLQRHKNKIRTGHLEGNRFEIRIRQVEAGTIDDAKHIVDEVASSGMPNFYGPQRFGIHGDGARIGSCLLRRQVAEVVDLLLSPRDGVEEDYREAYAAGDIQEALRRLPPGRNAESGLLSSLRTHPGNLRAAVRRIPAPLRRMYYSAYQAELFNWVLMERMARSPDAFRVPWSGDVCQFEGSRSRFHVDLDETATEREKERALKGEISPTGPIFGRKMSLPAGEAGRIESAVLISEGLRPESWLSHVRGLKLDGTRRSLRILVRDPEVIWEQPEQALLLSFTLPAGSFATVLLEQVMGSGSESPTV